jgi:hypothetical protein
VTERRVDLSRRLDGFNLTTSPPIAVLQNLIPAYAGSLTIIPCRVVALLLYIKRFAPGDASVTARTRTREAGGASIVKRAQLFSGDGVRGIFEPHHGVGG